MSNRKKGMKHVWHFIIGIIVVTAVIASTACENSLYAEAEAIWQEATAPTRIPAAPKSPTISAVDGPDGDGIVVVSWDVVPGTTAYDVYYSSTVSPPFLSNGGTDLEGLSCTIAGLTNWETYYFWIIAKNKLGSSPLSIPPATGKSGIRVTSVTLNKSTVTTLAGMHETVIASVFPTNATFPDVTWATTDASHAIVANGVVTGGDSAGAAIITATVSDSLSASLTVTNRIYVLGEAGLAGGVLFYDKGAYSGGWRYLEAAPVSWNVAGDVPAPWIIGGNTQTTINGNTAAAIGSGMANSNAIIAQQGHTNSAAAVCRAYIGGGKNDWFLPSKDELYQMYLQATPLVLAGVYWSSSEVNAINAWSKPMYSGAQFDTFGKGAPTNSNYDYKVRPIRAF